MLLLFLYFFVIFFIGEEQKAVAFLAWGKLGEPSAPCLYVPHQWDSSRQKNWGSCIQAWIIWLWEMAGLFSKGYWKAEKWVQEGVSKKGKKKIWLLSLRRETHFRLTLYFMVNKMLFHYIIFVSLCFNIWICKYICSCKVVFLDKISVIQRLEIINLLSYVHFKRKDSDLYTGKAFQKAGKEFQNHTCAKDLGSATAS